MRAGFCVGMILRSDDTVASAGTLATMLKLGQVANSMDLAVELIPLMGAGKDLARSQVLAAFRAHSSQDDLLWIDFGNAFPTFPGQHQHEIIAQYLHVLLSSEREALYCPYTTRGGRDLSFTCSPPGPEHPRSYVEVESGVRLMRLGGCGFGFTRIRRSLVDKLYAKFGAVGEGSACRGFRSDHSEFGELDCIDVFSSRLGRREHDFERKRERPVRLLPEDDTFWTWARAVGVHPFALVDMPVDHNRTTPGINAPPFGEFAGIDEPEPKAQRIIMPNGEPAIREKAVH